MIEVLFQEGENFVTAGKDGWIKWWNVTEVDSAEAEEGLDFAIKPVKQLRIVEDAAGLHHAEIINITVTDGKFYIQDQKGKIWRLDRATDKYEVVYDFLQGAITAITYSPTHDYLLQLGEKGELRVVDSASKRVVHKRKFLGDGTCLVHFPHTEHNKGRLFAAGFSTGVVRIFNAHADNMIIMKAFKAH
jgi:hypothetical protein